MKLTKKNLINALLVGMAIGVIIGLIEQVVVGR